MFLKDNHVVPILVGATIVSFILTATFNGLGGAGASDLFNQSVGDISDKYDVFITPIGWTFTIWSVIYTFLAAGAVYSATTLFRSRGSERLYTQAPTLTWTYYSVLIVNYILNTIWIFIWLYEYVVAAAIVLLFIAYTAWLTIGITCYNTSKAVDQINTDPNGKLIINEVRIQRVLIQNGIGIYATWTTIASLLNLNIAFQYVGKFDAEVVSLVCCSILLAIIIVWFILENTVFDKYVRYLVSQYPVVIFASGGIAANLVRKNASNGKSVVPESVLILTWTVLAVASVLLLSRIVIVVYRYKTRPLHSSVKSTNS